ncbi:MAG TPA: hypothetical protein VH969_17540 [Actinophytocola sp.]|jgi:hypothetical protein|uniref:hypothetical protein n=1 Tax=Actinophytocola sp. TaxID=1872138 RepID=UPI002F943D31
MLDAGGGAAIAGAVQGIAAGTKQLANVAAEGHFAISEEGGRALLQAIKEMRHWIHDQSNRLTQLAQQPPIGGSYGAETIKPYAQSVATDQQGFIAMLKEFGDSLADAEQGINDAMDNYRKMDTDLAKPYTVEA